MPSLPPFNVPGCWYKGNLHCHTTDSDGNKSPEEVMRWYADHGYSFLSITDHNRLTFPPLEGYSPILHIPGTEITCRDGVTEYHIIGIGLDEMPIQPFHTPQETIDAINLSGGLSIIAHPYWHDLQVEDILHLSEYIGIEIFNTSCWVEIQKGHSLVHWDGLLRRGPGIWGFATDDAHWNYPDYGGGWIMLHSDSLNQSSVMDSIKNGYFYSTMGPEIFDIGIDGNYLYVKCSPVRSIYVLGQYYYCPNSVNVWDGYSGSDGCSKLLDPEVICKTITEASFKLDPRQEYLRVEVVDYFGRSAWSNPYYKNTGQVHWG